VDKPTLPWMYYVSTALTEKSLDQLRAVFTRYVAVTASGPIHDARDVMVGLVPYIDCARRLGSDPDKVLGPIAESGSAEFREIFRTFVQRTDITLAAFGWSLTEFPEGMAYRSAPWVPPLPPGSAAPSRSQQQRAWGASPPGRTDYWGEPDSVSRPKRTSHTARNGCLIGCGAGILVAIALVVLLVAQVRTVLAPALDVSAKIQQNSDGQVTSAIYLSDNGAGEFIVALRPGATPGQAHDIACRIVRPALMGTQFEGTKFEVLGSYGTILADETTVCG
jgi:hypothetical protein